MAVSIHPGLQHLLRARGPRTVTGVIAVVDESGDIEFRLRAQPQPEKTLRAKDLLQRIERAATPTERRKGDDDGIGSRL